MAFDFIKVKEKIHIVNIGKCGPEGEGGEGRAGCDSSSCMWCQSCK